MFRFGAKSEISVVFDNIQTKPKKTVTRGDQSVILPIYSGAEGVSGNIEVIVPRGKKLDHQGIKVELIGQIEQYADRSSNFDFVSLTRELEPEGSLFETTNYRFDFSTVEKPYESYSGINVRLRYFVRATVSKSYGSSNMSVESEFLVFNVTNGDEEALNTLKMEVGIEDCLHIEFEYSQQRYHLADVVLGKVFFLLVRIKIKYMELAIIKRESAGTGNAILNESETIGKFELMDGAPVRGECVPIRVFLGHYDLTPTYRSVTNKFSVKYYLNLVLVDEEDRRYFKQQEIILWRKNLPLGDAATVA